MSKKPDEVVMDPGQIWRAVRFPTQVKPRSVPCFWVDGVAGPIAFNLWVEPRLTGSTIRIGAADDEWRLGIALRLVQTLPAGSCATATVRNDAFLGIDIRPGYALSLPPDQFATIGLFPARPYVFPPLELDAVKEMLGLDAIARGGPETGESLGAAWTHLYPEKGPAPKKPKTTLLS